MRKKIKDFVLFTFLSFLFCIIIYVFCFLFLVFRVVNQKGTPVNGVYFKSAEEQIKSEMMIQGGLLSR